MKTAFKISKLFLYLAVSALGFSSLMFLNINALEMHVKTNDVREDVAYTFYGLIHGGLSGQAYENMMYISYFLGAVIAGYGLACFLLSLFKPDRGTELSGNIIIFIACVYNFFVSEFIGEMLVSDMIFKGATSATYTIGPALISWMGLYAGAGFCILLCAIFNIILKRAAEKESIKLAKMGVE